MASQKRKYITGIDGLRSIAVVGVILYHLIPRYMPGGYLGVTLFFVISGYLMTDILLNQWENRKKIGLKNFYYKRARRIYPSLIMMLIITGSTFVFVSKDLLLNFKQIVVSSLLNVNNFWQILSGSSYFDRFGNESAFTHLWSLSIEGQFYILWPIVVALLVFKRDDFKLLGQVILTLTILSGVLMFAFYHPDNVNRIYYGTDTRLFSILMGAYLAIFLREKDEMLMKIDEKIQIVAWGISLLMIILSFVYLKDSSVFVYRGGMFLFSLICMILLGLVVSYDKPNAFLTNPLFKWIGTRSYEIYLWQFPVMISYEKMIKFNGDHSWVHFVIQLTLILLLSEITYRVVQFFVFDIKFSKENMLKVIETLQGKIAAVGTVILLLLFSYSLIIAPSGRTEASVALQKKLEQNKKIIENKNEKTVSSSSTESKEKETTETINQEANDTLTNEESTYLKKIKLTAIGDSLLLSAAPEVQDVFPDNYIDAEVGRQLVDSEDVFKKTVSDKKIGDVVLVVLGTNGSFDSKDIDNIMNKLGDKPVFFVNTMVQRSWQKAVNDELDKTAKRYKNAHVIDWKSYSEGKQTWFEADDLHLTPEGATAFSNLVGKNIYEVMNKK
ncbi:acyltransferase family protein [Vagococcus carniphilus]|uniref:Acyltransferase family protein n=1 Tax=Vagococcus carniphilus TaxID=218144 RepID=A0AAW8U4I3_9ENTE|nr:acyltransferase family protein [Vagococcus carniphilus]MDT2829597.1 acyltransferase family protein [Vagococcus carniphilus]MDT2833701.1 acyltransferase family protein [Vagococcus carniphilus]MDT2839056.1 acyltransferase family protein [Vagococcus carniphilus]MDT2853114.1 acyltransferase family protein [Vagococcus carniphilus]